MKVTQIRFSKKAQLAVGLLFALTMSGLLAVMNISSGPLHNLNDIGGWHNRALYIALVAAVQALLLAFTALISRGGVLRMLLRQIIVTAGFFILLLPINQKSLAFMEQLLPLIRAMDEGGLAAIAGMNTNLSSPALTLIYLMTRGPIYDMYMLKLFCVAALVVLSLLMMHAADRKGVGFRAEVVLAFCLILPQGFMSAACAAQTDVMAAALVACAFALALREKPLGWAAALCFGLAVCVSGAALYALPALIALVLNKKMTGVQLACAFAVVLVLCLPAVMAGQPALKALVSPLRVVFGAPDYASGAPNIMNLFPRSAMEEMPEYFMLSQLEPLEMVDPIKNFSPYYTAKGFDAVMRGMAILGLAMAAIVWALTLRRSQMSALARAFALTLASLMACPGASAGAWVIASMLAMLVIFCEPQLRIPSCFVLFGAAGAAAYPVTGEILLPMIICFALCAAALLWLLGMFDANLGKAEA